MGHCRYFATREGEIFSYTGAQIMGSLSHKGYLTAGGKYIHRIIAEAFLADYSEDLQVDHINGIKTDNRVENLEMVTNAQNMQHALSLGLVDNKGSRNGMALLTEEQVLEIRYLLAKANYCQSTIADLYGVSRDAINDIRTNRTWKHL